MVGIADDFSKLTPWELYQFMWYLAMGLLGCNSYGDMVPLTPAE